MLAAIAVEGVGIAFEPDFIVSPLIKAGKLVPILKNYQPAPLPIYAIYPSRRHLSAKVRSFVDFLVERFADKRDWS
jgi:DNA-binding transcriptional LysR family regulator